MQLVHLCSECKCAVTVATSFTTPGLEEMTIVIEPCLCVQECSDCEDLEILHKAAEAQQVKITQLELQLKGARQVRDTALEQLKGQLKDAKQVTDG